MNREKKSAMGLSVAIGIAVASAAAITLLGPNSVAQSHPEHISGRNGWTCSYTTPEYMIHSGGTNLQPVRGRGAFTARYANAPLYMTWEDPYLTTGYEGSLNSGWYCNGRRSFSPPKLGRQGDPTVWFHDSTTPDFYGDTGLDVWFEPSKSDTSYASMTNQGADSTEIMIWASHPGLNLQTQNRRYYPVIVGGHHWRVITGLASQGHGKTNGRDNGWNVVNFIAPDIGSESLYKGLRLDPFFTYAIRHGWLNPQDYLMSLSQGAELTSGEVRICSYYVKGLKGN